MIADEEESDFRPLLPHGHHEGYTHHATVGSYSVLIPGSNLKYTAVKHQWVPFISKTDHFDHFWLITYWLWNINSDIIHSQNSATGRHRSVSADVPGGSASRVSSIMYYLIIWWSFTETVLLISDVQVSSSMEDFQPRPSDGDRYLYPKNKLATVVSYCSYILISDRLLLVCNQFRILSWLPRRFHPLNNSWTGLCGTAHNGHLMFFFSTGSWRCSSTRYSVLQRCIFRDWFTHCRSFHACSAFDLLLVMSSSQVLFSVENLIPQDTPDTDG